MTKIKWKKIIIKKERVSLSGKSYNAQIITICLFNSDTNKFLVSPLTAFLSQYRNRKSSTIDSIANSIVAFLNFVYFNSDIPIRSIHELSISHGYSFINSLDVSISTQKKYANDLTKFYYFLNKNLDMPFLDDSMFNIHLNQFNKQQLDSIFSGQFYSSNKELVKKLPNIEEPYLYMFIKTAIDVAPDIALGVFFQLFGGLRKSEVISLEYKNCSVRQINGYKTITLNLSDKDLRPDLDSAFISKCKINRLQVVIPAFHNLLFELFDYQKHHFKSKYNNAIFVDANGNAMTASTYARKFNKVKNAFIDRLLSSDNLSDRFYGRYIQTKRWSTHIGRGTFTNLVSQNCDDVKELATWRGDSNLSSAMAYLVDSKPTMDKIMNCLDSLYSKEE